MLEPQGLACLVINAGTHPEPQHVAAALAKAGHHVTYITASQYSISGPWSWLLTGSPARIRKFVESRVLFLTESAGIRVQNRGVLLEVGYQIAKRLGWKGAPSIMRRRTRFVEARAAREIVRTAGKYDLVISQNTSATLPFRACPAGTVKVLLQPIVRVKALRKILEDEALMNPDWAFALPNLPPAQPRDPELELADLIVVGSEFVARSVRDETSKPIVVANYGAPEPSGTRNLRQYRASTTLKLLFVGQVNQRKGIAYLLTAMEELHDDCHLTLVGDISVDVRQHVSNYSNVTVLGGLSRSDVVREYHRADMLVLPSLAEGFALVVPEAMSTGLPCVVSDNTGSSELIEDGMNGMIVPIRDSSAIVDAVSRILRDPPLLQRLSKNAWDTAQGATWAAFEHKVAEGILDARRNLVGADAAGNAHASDDSVNLDD